MSEWFETLSMVEQSLFLVAVFSTAIFAIQFLLTLTGFSDEGDFDTESDGSSFDFGDIFTLRNGITFLMGFSWGGLMAYEWGLSHPFAAAFIGSIVGTVFVAANLVLLFALSKIKNSGNLNLDNAIDEEGRVSLTVPAGRTGVGKVTVAVQGRLKEFHAVTDGAELSRNTPVVVLEVLGSQLVVAGVD